MSTTTAPPRAVFEQQAAELAALRAGGMTLKDARGMLGLSHSAAARRLDWWRKRRGPSRPPTPSAPAAIVWRWQDAAACRDAGDLFFGPDGERGADRDVREKQATVLCAGCPVRSECLEYALRRPEAYGVWGGLGEDERKALKGRRYKQAAKARARSQEDGLAEAS